MLIVKTEIMFVKKEFPLLKVVKKVLTPFVALSQPLYIISTYIIVVLIIGYLFCLTTILFKYDNFNKIYFLLKNLNL